jgi:hypothetical protein
MEKENNDGTINWDEIGEQQTPAPHTLRAPVAGQRGKFDWGPIYALRRRKLTKLGFHSYKDYLASDWWQQRRARFEEEHPATCAHCGRVADDLHHLTYANLGAERDEDLRWMCRQHHAEYHEMGSIQPATVEQRRILVEEHCFRASFARQMSFAGAWNLIELLGRGLQPNEDSWRSAPTRHSRSANRLESCGSQKRDGPGEVVQTSR